ncbi:cellulose synthase subunit BcsC-related outer membrane protein [Rehaibacterium terrae]|uniref:Tetratricopeptide (TPR) repeat protein n=1 Tax=Rehaibacterium terrae TaxID=1341696 RepID=A0A7W7Y087_9GAMM|nr:cellulose synthase subunit BcsC-related outer membrane protein [Rehaibacterium terrae]MBB5015710.1 tetratricopeptide (TPR) repeat protein [Rehaibacterium terrae]
MKPAVVLPPLLLLGMSSEQTAPEILPRMDSGIEVRPLDEPVEVRPLDERVEVRPLDERVRILTPPTPPGEQRGTAPRPLPAIDASKSEIGRKRKTAGAEQDSEKAAQAAYDQAVAAAITAFDAQDYAQSAEILIGLWPRIQDQADVGMMVLLGYAAMHSNRETLAIEAMTKAAELTGDDEILQSLADVLHHFERYEDASAVIARITPSPDRDARLAELAMIRAERARQTGDHGTAHALLLANEEILPPAGLEQLGWQLYERGQAEQAAARFEAAYRQAPSESRAQGLVFSLHSLNDHARLLTIVEETEGPLDQLIDENVRNRIAAGHHHFSVDSQARLEAVSTLAGGTPPGMSLRLGPEIRKKRGTPGEGKLSQRGLMLEANWQDAANDLHLEIEHQRADNHVERATGQRVYGLWRHRLESGLQTRLGLGRTLSGGAVGPALIGEVGLEYQQADHGGGLRLFRGGNEESLLALAGQRDPTTGASWGRVLETGVQLDGRLNPGEWEVIGSLTFSTLSGEQVADNRKVELYAHALHPVASVNGLRLGPELYSARFRHNLGFFEPGHGGYFSPSFHLKPGLLADYNQRIGERVDIEARAGLGWAWNRQAAADGNPLRGEEPGKYAASRDNGIAYHGRIQATWEITPHWQAGLHAGGQKSPEYTDWQGGVFLQWRWGK